MRHLTSLLVLLLCGFSLSAQIEFFKAPKPMQLFARDVNNFGHFEVAGKSSDKGILRSVLTEMQSGDVVESFSIEIKPGLPFSLNHKIPACLKEYQLDVYFTDSTLVELNPLQRSNLLAGDFFLAAGQSNMSCPPSEGWQKHDSIYSSPFTRAIGGDFSWANTLNTDSIPIVPLEEDCMFGRPSVQAYFTNGHGFSGIWPMKLQYELAQASGIPNCIINSSQGGVSISRHFASHTPSHPDSLSFNFSKKHKRIPLLYDRAYKKFHMNNAVQGVKAVFWYQGETDGTYDRDSSANYDKRFQKLYNSWKADYPSLQKIFVVQINLGCGGDHHSLIREIQRRFPEKYTDVVVMSSVGSPVSDRSADLCHYSVKGYARIATKILPLAKHYLYGFPEEDEFTLPANIKSADYVQKNQITLEFNKPVILQDSCVYGLPDPGTAYMKNSFFNEQNQSIKIDSVGSEKNKVFLYLNPATSTVNRITYLPNIFSPIPSVYAGPWILNQTNPEIGAYSFYEFPVKPFQVKEEEEEEEEPEPEPAKRFAIYPNPADEELSIEFKQDLTYTISIRDLYGRQIQKLEFSGNILKRDISTLPAGVYFLTIKSTAGTTTTKLLIE